MIKYEDEAQYFLTTKASDVRILVEFINDDINKLEKENQKLKLKVNQLRSELNDD